MTFPSNTIAIVTYVSAGLSVIGCLIIISLFIAIPRLRIPFTARLILYLSIADLFASSSHFLPSESGYGWCQFQAWMQNGAYLASFAWMLCIAITTYLITSHHESVAHKYEPLMLVACTLIPFIDTLILQLFDVMGDTDLWCWIPIQHYSWRWFAFYFPLIGVILAITILSGLTLRSLRHQHAHLSHSSSASLSLLSFQSTFYIITFIIIRLPSLIHRTVEYLDPDGATYGLQMLHAIGSPLQGGINALLFVNNRHVRHLLRSVYHRRYPLLSPSVTSPSSYIPLDEDSDVNMTALPTPPPSLRPVIHTVIPETIPVRKQLTVRVCTWNLGNKHPPSPEKLQSWLSPGTHDIYAVGTQECHYRADVRKYKWWQKKAT